MENVVRVWNAVKAWIAIIIIIAVISLCVMNPPRPKISVQPNPTVQIFNGNMTNSVAICTEIGMKIVHSSPIRHEMLRIERNGKEVNAVPSSGEVMLDGTTHTVYVYYSATREWGAYAWEVSCNDGNLIIYRIDSGRRR